MEFTERLRERVWRENLVCTTPNPFEPVVSARNHDRQKEICSTKNSGDIDIGPITKGFDPVSSLAGLWLPAPRFAGR